MVPRIVSIATCLRMKLTNRFATIRPTRWITACTNRWPMMRTAIRVAAIAAASTAGLNGPEKNDAASSAASSASDDQYISLPYSISVPTS
ncbi:hypothetical protein NG2371_05295 [Nocardia gamkensis]|nr:hypothetical protein [Nocardia gamkensis]